MTAASGTVVGGSIAYYAGLCNDFMGRVVDNPADPYEVSAQWQIRYRDRYLGTWGPYTNIGAGVVWNGRNAVGITPNADVRQESDRVGFQVRLTNMDGITGDWGDASVAIAATIGTPKRGHTDMCSAWPRFVVFSSRRRR